MSTRNPFRSPEKRKVFDAMQKAYAEKNRDIFLPDGSRSVGNSPAMYFWRGFDGVGVGSSWDAFGKTTMAYVYWRAGQEAKRHATT